MAFSMKFFPYLMRASISEQRGVNAEEFRLHRSTTEGRTRPGAGHTAGEFMFVFVEHWRRGLLTPSSPTPLTPGTLEA